MMAQHASRRVALADTLRLAWMLAKRDVRNRYASSYAGVIWTIGIPLLYALINVVVFSILMNGRMGVQYGNIPFALFYFLPFSLWSFFADVTGRSTGILREYAYLINKIAFPFWVLPLIPLASALMTQAVLLSITGLLMLKMGVPLGDTAWWFIPLWLTTIVLSMGVAYAVSAFSVYVPDLAQIVPVVINIMFWLTPILYPATLVKEHGALWVRSVIMDYNPFYYLVELARHSVFGTAPISVFVIVNLALVALFVLFLGMELFHKLRSGFADVI